MRRGLGPWIAMALFVADPGAAPPETPSRGDVGGQPIGTAYTCGVLALDVLCRLEGVQAGPEPIRSHLPDAPAGNSLAELRDAARLVGLELRGARLGTGDWPLDRPALVHLDEGRAGHFVVIRPVGHTGTLVQVIDPTRAVEVRDAAALFADRSWTGMALVPLRMRDRAWYRPVVVLGALFVTTSAYLLIAARLRTGPRRGRDVAATGSRG